MMADGSVCMAEVFWCMVLKGSSRQALPQGCTVDPSWRTANGKREREAGKLSASRVAETGKWHQREQTGGHNWEKKEGLRDNTYGHNIRVRHCVCRGL